MQGFVSSFLGVINRCIPALYAKLIQKNKKLALIGYFSVYIYI